LAGHLLDRLADRTGFTAVHVALDGAGDFRFAFRP
jgi:hypothetical protein